MEEKYMKKYFSQLSILLTFLLVFQFLSPVVNTYAQGTLSTPTNFKVELRNSNDLYLSWDAVSGAERYRVYRITDNVKTIFADTIKTSWYKLGVDEGVYTLAIAAYKTGVGESALSSPTTFVIDFPEIASPSNLTYTISNINDVTLKWNSVPEAKEYKVNEIINGQKVTIGTVTRTTRTITNLSKGEHIFEVVTVTERFGESQVNNQIKVPIVFPEVKAPEEITYSFHNGNDLKLSWLPSENANSYNVYQVDGSGKKLIGGTTEQSRFIYNLAEGTYVFEISAVSDRYGESSNNNKITIDVIFPSLQAPLGMVATVENGNEALLKWKSSQFATSYKVYQMNNGDKTLLTTVTSTTARIPGLDEGDHSFEVTSFSDRFGESVDSAKGTVTVIYPDLSAPVAELRIVDKNDAFINWAIVPFAKKYQIYQIIDGEYRLVATSNSTGYVVQDLGDGKHHFAVSAFNEDFGTSPMSNIVEANIVPVLNAPAVEQPEQSGNDVSLTWAPVPNADSYNVYKVVDGEEKLVGTTKDTSLTVEDLSPGNYEFKIVPVAPSGVEGDKFTTVEVQVEQLDTTPPQTVANESTDWLQDEYEVKLTATDDQSGVAQTFYSINGLEFTEGTAFTVTEEGVNTVFFYSVDNAGNIEEVKTTEVKIDKTAPVTKSDIATQWKNEKMTVKLTATDDLSGVAKTFYSINGSAFTEGNTLTITTEGITQVSFYSVDNAGNQEEAEIEEVMVDNTAPVTKSDITDQRNKDAVRVKLSATDDLSGVAKTYYSINGSEYFVGNSFTVTGEGVIQVSFYSVDNAGNSEAVKTEFVKIDNQAPETVSDVTDNWNTGNVTVNLTAIDNQSGVAATFYSVNGSEYVEGTEFTVSHEGINKVSFYSIDNVGNKEEAKNIDVKIDKTSPITVSDINDKWNQDEVTVNLLSTDNLSGVAKTYYSINGSDYAEGTQFTVSEEGINIITFYSVDNAGNKEELQTVEVKIDKTAPVVTWDVANQYALGASLPLTYKAADDYSGIAKETITVNGQIYENTDSVKLDKPGAYKVVVTVTDHAGWMTTLEKTIEVYIPATLIVNPGVIKANAGDFTVKISLPKGIDTNQIDLSTATLNGVFAKSGTNGLVQQAKNGQFKFNRDDFDWKKGMVTVEFRVLVNGVLVIGSTTVEVK
jgi:large repetitive protein